MCGSGFAGTVRRGTALRRPGGIGRRGEWPADMAAMLGGYIWGAGRDGGWLLFDGVVHSTSCPSLRGAKRRSEHLVSFGAKASIL
jgi:hypothetical protein